MFLVLRSKDDSGLVQKGRQDCTCQGVLHELHCNAVEGPGLHRHGVIGPSVEDPTELRLGIGCDTCLNPAFPISLFRRASTTASSGDLTD